jgi:hypothetical protein
MQVQKFTDEQLKEEAEKLRLEIERKAEEELAEICRKHKVSTAYRVLVPTNETYTDFATAFLKYPPFEAYSIALTLQDKHPLKGKKIMIDSMWLEGDERLKDNSKEENLPLFYSLCTVIDDILDIKAALLKKKSVNSLSETVYTTN